MRHTPVFLFLFLFSYYLSGQNTRNADTVADDKNGGRSIVGADTDDDGDTNIVAAFYGNNEMVRYENDGTQGAAKQIINATLNESQFATAADTDSNGDLEILSAQSPSPNLLWLEQALPVDPASPCGADYLSTGIDIGEIHLVPMGQFSSTSFSITDNNEIELGYWEDDTYVTGENGGTNADGNFFNPAKDTIAIKGIAPGTQQVSYDDPDCNPTTGLLPMQVFPPNSVCGITGMQSQVEQGSSFAIDNSSSTGAFIQIIGGNYPNTIGIEKSGATGNNQFLNNGESGSIVADATTALGTYQVQIENFSPGCAQITDVEVIPPGCNVTPFSTQMTLGSSHQFTSLETDFIRIKELSEGYPTAPGLDSDSDHTTDVYFQLFRATNDDGWIYVPPTAALGVYDIQLSAAPGPGCLSTRQIEIIAALPVTLTGFTATPKNQIVQLDWRTAAEQDNAGFRVQRSADGRSWQDLAFVSGAGSTDTPQSYAHTDRRPLSAVNYYRLAQEDYDGSINFSEIVKASIAQPEGILLFPNPVRDELTVSGAAGQTLLLCDTHGRVLRRLYCMTEAETFGLSGLPVGVYVLRAETGGFVRRVVKQ